MSIITEALKKAAREKDVARKRPDNIVSAKREADSEKVVGTVRPPLNPGSTAQAKSVKSNTRYVKNKILILSGGVLLLAITFMVINNVAVNMKEAMPIGTPADSKDVPVEAEAYSDVTSEVALIEDRGSLIDKMTKALTSDSVEEEFLSSFTLNGIIYDTDDYWAIVNNKIVRVGDKLDGATVISIAPQKVILLFKEERFDLAVK